MENSGLSVTGKKGKRSIHQSAESLGTPGGEILGDGVGFPNYNPLLRVVTGSSCNKSPSSSISGLQVLMVLELMTILTATEAMMGYHIAEDITKDFLHGGSPGIWWNY